MNVKQTVSVTLDKHSYDIYIGPGILSNLIDMVPCDLKGRNVFVLADENVSALYAASVCEQLKAADVKSAPLLTLSPGEQSKSWEGLQQVTSWMLENGANRDSILFAVGGGVIGDLGGFAAAIMMRGIPFVQIPTTLLAQVDSSVGGKTAIDVPQGKNLVGAFHQPIAVIADTDTLKTLPRRELLAGYAETVKYGLINDPEFFQWLGDHYTDVLNLEPNAISHAIKTACEKKAEIVSADEKEKSGQRILLNLGHTFAHALEAAAGYESRLLHGEAVAIGMVLAYSLSEKIGLCPPEDTARVKSHIKATGLPTSIDDITPALNATADDLIGFMQLDKKMTKSGLTFVLTEAIGKALTKNNIDELAIRTVLSDSMKGNT